MLIFISFLLATNMLVAQFFDFVYINVSAIYTILALIIFGAIALMFLQGTRRFSGVALIVTVLLYAAVELLAPYIVPIGWIISAIVAIVVTVNIKRPMLRMIRRQALPTWARVFLSIL